ncbi:hypothetical protein M378DRAFT_163720 [Amanita muscaria Koide BX008]|uniref:Uncharacterized protein n=1 Tax=Amanita muscaria (strain Koide BX008) TaxID=946122 RepID=A0A0C2SLJ4_AMAMK|nr:hypothetical protein M378DRAFT_163720 [Amanita muscaria Koide BX008]
MSSPERRKGKPGKVWDAVMNWTAGGSGKMRSHYLTSTSNTKNDRVLSRTVSRAQ